MLKSIVKAFTDHPKDIGENYFQHLTFTIKMMFRFMWVGAAMVIHGLLPFLFEHTGSEQITKMYKMMKTRTPENLQDHYHI
ncbi:MAG: DUF6356 family protein [Rickettsiales bacterium]